MKKRQLIATLACLLVGMAGFAGAYTLEQTKESDQQQEAEITSTEIISQVSGVIEPETSDEGASETEERTPESIVTAADTAKESDGTEEAESEVSSEVSAEAVSQADVLHFASELRWPLEEGSVILDYSMDHMIYFPTLEQYQYNPAMIISAETGDKVYIVAEGTITDISTSEVTGLTVTEDLGDGYTAIYGQLEELNFAVGDSVERGHVLGTVAEPTKYYSVEGTNLYFAMEYNGEAVNPLEYFDE